jgi:hypothetical protein
MRMSNKAITNITAERAAISRGLMFSLIPHHTFMNFIQSFLSLQQKKVPDKFINSRYGRKFVRSTINYGKFVSTSQDQIY